MGGDLTASATCRSSRAISPYPDSDSDVLYMNLDVLDETFPMVKSKLPFEYFDRGGLTGWAHRLDRPA
jgi:hypothetical protein